MPGPTAPPTDTDESAPADGGSTDWLFIILVGLFALWSAGVWLSALNNPTRRR